MSTKEGRVSPAEYVFQIFGGVRATARAINRDPAALFQWRRPYEAKGTGGEIPRSAMRDLLDAARERGLDLNGDDLILGRPIPESQKDTQA